MFNEWYRPDCFLEFPVGGSQVGMWAMDMVFKGFKRAFDFNYIHT